jgi:hypothetical protein
MIRAIWSKDPGDQPPKWSIVPGELQVETASGAVFRLACTAEVTRRHAEEIRLLPWLGRQLPIPIPQPRWLVPPNRALPYGAIGYPKLAGNQMPAEAMAAAVRPALVEQVAGFMRALHALPVDVAMEKSGTQFVDRVYAIEETRRKALIILRPHLSRADYDRVERCWNVAWGRWRCLQRWGYRTLSGSGGHMGDNFEHRLFRYWQLSSFYTIELAARRKIPSLFTEGIERPRPKEIIE